MGRGKITVVEDILTILALYRCYVPFGTIARLYGVTPTTIWKMITKFEKLGLVKMRTRSETVSETLSRIHTKPEGEVNPRVKIWKERFGEEGLKDLLTIFLLTDGSCDFTRKTITLDSTDKTLLEIFTDILHDLRLNPRSAIDKRTVVKSIFARNNSVKKLIETDILSRTPTTKHQPQRGYESWSSYLKQKQPTLSFLFNKPYELKMLAFRIAMSTEGCALIDSKCGKRCDLPRPYLLLTCFHPKLIKEWDILIRDLGFSPKLYGTKLKIYKFSDILKFLEAGGFLEGCVNCGKSKYFYNVDKNKVLLNMLEFTIRARQVRKFYNSRKANIIIQKLIKSNACRDLNFYKVYFKNLARKREGIEMRTRILNLLQEPKYIKDIISASKLNSTKIWSAVSRYQKQGLIKKLEDGKYTIAN